MRVALVHDYIKEYGGAERVLEALHEIYPQAPVYTTVYLPDFLGPHRKRFETWDIRASKWNKVPYIHKLISPLRIFTPWIFENIDFSSFDLIIVSATGAYFPNLILRKPYTTHICYCHTPPRYLYGYPTARDWKRNPFFRLFAAFFNHKLRAIDFISAQRPDFFIANSEETRRRLEKFYRREAEVIYPPVDVEIRIKNNESRVKGNKKYFLAGGRLARAKRIDLAIEACKRLKLPLKVFGKGFANSEAELKKMSGLTVEFVGEVDDVELINLYRNAKAYVCSSEYEDFGITPIESMANGTPVIALNQGGLKESIINGKTGVLFDEPTVESLMQAIKRFNNMAIMSEDCINQAKKFSKERFKKEIKDLVRSKCKNQKDYYA